MGDARPTADPGRALGGPGIVLVVGTASYLVPDAFPDQTVWSHFGQGYGYVPLVLPVLGLLWFRRVERLAAATEAPASGSTLGGVDPSALG